MDLLKKLLKNIGVEDFHQLDPDEKKKYIEYEKALSGKKLTDKDVSEFLNYKENEIIKELINTEISEKKDAFLKMQLDLIRQIKMFLFIPEMERKMAEQELQDLLTN